MEAETIPSHHAEPHAEIPQYVEEYFNRVHREKNGHVLTCLDDLPRSLYPNLTMLRPDHISLNDRADGHLITSATVAQMQAVLQCFIDLCLRTNSCNIHPITVHTLLKMPKILLILEIMNRSDLLQGFLEGLVDDNDLPLDYKQVRAVIGDEETALQFLGEQYRACPRELPLGKHINFEKYEPLPMQSLRLLGRGGFAIVDEVEVVPGVFRLARKVWMCAGKQAVNQLEKETAVLRKLQRHTHTIQLVNTYNRENEVGLLMSPVASGDLWVTLNSTRRIAFLSDDSLRRSLGCLSVALAQMHELGIRHKDIKPQNILVYDGRLLFTDFGLSFDVSAATASITEGRPAFRTAKYCAPEVGEWEQRGRLADVFSLGCVLMEVFSVLEGILPSASDSFSQLAPFYERLDKVDEWIRTRLNSAVDPSKRLWLEICSKMLRKKEYRPRMQELVEEILAESRQSHTLPVHFCQECLGNVGIIRDIQTFSASSSVDKLQNDYSSAECVSAGLGKDALTGPTYAGEESVLPNSGRTWISDSSNDSFQFQSEAQKERLAVMLRRMSLRHSLSDIPCSFLIALANRFTLRQIQQFRVDMNLAFSQFLPFFFCGAFIFPSTVRMKTYGTTLRGIAEAMTVATIRGYRRHAVRRASWPAMVPTNDPRDKICGMVVFGLQDSQRRSIHEFQSGMFDFKRDNVEIELRDGSKIQQEVGLYVWNQPPSLLVPIEERMWSPSDLLESEWFSYITEGCAEEEEALGTRIKENPGVRQSPFLLVL